MNINSNSLKVLAGALLVASLPAGAQVLGGGLTGAAGGMLGGSIGPSGIHGAGNATGTGAFGADDTTLRDRAARTTGGTREAAAGNATSAGSKADAISGTTNAAAQAAHSSSVNAGRKQTTPPAATAPPSGGTLLLGGSANAEKRAMGRRASARGNASSETSAGRDGILNSSGGDAGVELARDEPAPAAPAAE